MAKATNVFHTELAGIHWFTKRNIGRDASNLIDETTRKTLIPSLAGGWHEDQPLTAVEMCEADIVLAMQERQAMWDTLKTAIGEQVFTTPDGSKIKLNAAKILKAWESAYVDSKGKLRKPAKMYTGVYAYQRASCLPTVLAFRTELASASGVKAPETYTIPVLVRSFDSQLELDIACIVENTSKTLGVTGVMQDWPSLFQAASVIRRGMLAKGEIYSEAMLLRKFGWPDSYRGRVQKLHFLILCDQLVTKKQESGDEDVDLSVCVHDLVVKHKLNVAKWRFKEDFGPWKKMIDAGDATVNDVVGWFTGSIASVPKMASKTAIEEVYKETPNKMVQLVLGAILNNKIHCLRSLPGDFNRQMGKLFNEACPFNVHGDLKEAPGGLNEDNNNPSGHELMEMLD